MTIYVTGDLHGAVEIWKLKKKAFPEGHLLTKNDFLIILGDFGLIWYPSLSGARGLWDHTPPPPVGQEEFWLGYLSEQPWTTLFIDGNHENFDRLLRYPTEDFNRGKASRIHDSVWYLRRGEVFELSGKSCFVMGGAASIDRQWRIHGQSWWPQEIPSPADLRNAQENLTKHANKVHFVFTHTCPLTIKGKLPLHGHLGNVAEKIDFTDPTEAMLESFLHNLQFDHWYFAHFHLDQRIDEKFSSVFDKVLRVS